VYQSDETRAKYNFEIYVKPYPPTNEKYQITKGGGMNPLWSPDGKEIFYRSRGKLMAVRVLLLFPSSSFKRANSFVQTFGCLLCQPLASS